MALYETMSKHQDIMPTELSYYGRSPRYMKMSLFGETGGPIPRSPREVQRAMDEVVADILKREHHSTQHHQLVITSFEASQRSDDLHHLISLCKFPIFKFK